MTQPDDEQPNPPPLPIRRRQVQGATLFLERAGYRQRRLRDALRMLPVLGVVLFLIPLLWRAGNQLPDSIDDTVPQSVSGGTAEAVVFVFASWAALIVITAVLARCIKPEVDATPDLDNGE
jgi:hypothetical protein